MRKAGPILILLIGILALIVVFFPGLQLPDSQSADGTWRTVETKQGADRVVVELPGVTDPEAVRKLVGQTGRLDFVPLGSTQASDGQQLDLKQFPPLFSGDQVASATVGTDQNGRPAVDFVLKGEGAALFSDYTAKNVGSYFAITLDGAVVSAPVIQNAIP